MTDALIGLLRRSPVGTAAWHDFWDRLGSGELRRGEAAAVVSSLTSRPPEHATTAALLASLAERRTGPTLRFPTAVNVVGTGGGVPTFNISTAAAFVAAAMGVQVVKTGSRAYTARYGSFDLLERLGVATTKSAGETGDTLDRFGIAFAGQFVYPPELTLLARNVLPLDMRVIGRFFNVIGPFLPAISMSAQLTGVSDPALLPALAHLAAGRGTRIWLCSNGYGADELLSVTDNTIHPADGSAATRIVPAALGLGGGALADLTPVAEYADPVEHFTAVLRGRGPAAAVHTVCLNAAALAVAGGVIERWPAAVAAATETVMSGAALELADAMRGAERERPVPVGAVTRA
jgi:anthranilate phosphoribosyltransferase